MKKIILFTAIAAVTCMLAGCEQNVNNPQVPHAGFSVAPNKYVKFAPGNLQYTQSTDTWAFATEQYEMLGTDNVVGGDVTHDATYGDSKSGTALSDRIDLFGWSSDAKWGVNTAISYSIYVGDFVDWGQNISDGTTWRTLTDDEWDYLLFARGPRVGVARIQISSNKYMNGLILLPDDWQINEEVFKANVSSDCSILAYADYQTFTLDQWSKLEAAGAVFLPALGYRRGSDVSRVQFYGTYWSATYYNSGYAYYLSFYSGGAGMYYDDRYYGRAVRLVQDVN